MERDVAICVHDKHTLIQDDGENLIRRNISSSENLIMKIATSTARACTHCTRDQNMKCKWNNICKSIAN